MTNEDRQSQQFIREVDEEFRRAQMKSLWDRFAPLVIAVCVLVVAVTAGYRGWLWWQERQAAQSGDLYLRAVEQLDAGNRAEAESTLNQLASGGGGYGILARMRLAADKASAGDHAAALAQFDAIAADNSVPGDMRDLARLRAGLLALDNGDPAGAKTRVQGLAVAGNSWRHAAREVLGTAAFTTGDLPAARTNFQAIQQDAEAPPDLRARAGLMMTLIEGQGEAPGAAASAPAAAEPSPPAPADTSAEPAPAPQPDSATRPPEVTSPAPVVLPAPAAPEPAPAAQLPQSAPPATIPTPPSPSAADAVQPAPATVNQPPVPPAGAPAPAPQ